MRVAKVCRDPSRRTACLFAYPCEGRFDKNQFPPVFKSRCMPGLGKPDTVMERLRAGKSIWQALRGIGSDRGFNRRCALHPEWGEEAKRLAETNAEQSPMRKGWHKRNLTHCKRGHPLSGDNIYIERDARDRIHRKCKACLQMHSQSPPLPSAEQIQRVTAALNAGKTIGQICWGRIGSERVGPHVVSFNKLKAYRRQNPDYDRFVSSVIAGSNSRAMHRRQHPQLFHAKVLRAERNDYHFVAALVPTNLPPDIREDIVQSIFVALLEGSLRRDQVKDRVREFVRAHNREAKKQGVGKYGLVSLDAPLFADGSKTLSDIETRSIWDEVPM